MRGASSGPGLCRTCGATQSPFSDFCQTCHVFDQWQLAVETSNVAELLPQIEADDIALIVHYVKRLKDKLRHTRNKLPSKRKTPQEFDFALQEIEKTTRGLELTSIEAVGVLEMVKQSFIEEMFYEDYSSSDSDSSNDDEEDDDKEL